MSADLTPERRWELRAHLAHGNRLTMTEMLALLDAADEVAKLRAALGKVNDVRNSIIGSQQVNWSEHIYPLVAALNEAGIEGMEYPDAKERFATTLERIASLEAENAKLRDELVAARADDWQVSRLLAWLRDPQRKEPSQAFTSGVLRDAAYEVKMMLGRSAREVRERIIAMLPCCSITNTGKSPMTCAQWNDELAGSGLCTNCRLVADIRGSTS